MIPHSCLLPLSTCLSSAPSSGSGISPQGKHEGDLALGLARKLDRLSKIIQIDGCLIGDLLAAGGEPIVHRVDEVPQRWSHEWFSGGTHDPDTCHRIM
jgi:hypothetical protein